MIVAETKVDRYYFDASVVKFFKPGDAQDLGRAISMTILDRLETSRLVRSAAAYSVQHSWANHKSVYLSLIEQLSDARHG